MKKLIVLVGVLGAMAAQASSVVKMPLLDYQPTENYAMYEIKTLHYQKVVLDCQGFIHGMYFYNSDKYERQIAMDEQDCDSLHEYLLDAHDKNKPVCLELNKDFNSLEVSETPLPDCK